MGLDETGVDESAPLDETLGLDEPALDETALDEQDWTNAFWTKACSLTKAVVWIKEASTSRVKLLPMKGATCDAFCP